jgi:hypothetical protein
MARARSGVTSDRGSTPLVNLPAMTDEQQIYPLLANVKVVDHTVIPHAKPVSICALQPVMACRRKVAPQQINCLANADSHPGRQRIKRLAECLRPNLCGRRHTELYTASGWRIFACPAAISPRARAIASVTSSRTTRSSSILSSSHARSWIKSARDNRSAACSNSCTVLIPI